MEKIATDESNSTNRKDPTIAHGSQAPADPSNTSHIGQRVEQGIISKDEGITTQSSEWEKLQDEGKTGSNLIDEKAEKYIKDPSPEENGE